MRVLGATRTGGLGWRAILARFWPPLAVFAVWRVTLFALGLAAQALFPFEVTAFMGPSPMHPLVAPWVRWDSFWYVQIAEQGYWHDLSAQHQSYAFFPLYPLLTSIVGRLVGDYYLAGLLVANVCFVAALVMLYALVEDRFDAAVAKRTVLFLTLSPFALFFGTPYTESLFLLLTVASFWLANRERWWASGLVAGLCSGTRLVGVALAPALMLVFWEQRGSKWRNLDRRVVAPLLALLGVAAYASYLFVAFGDPLAFYRASAIGWYRYNPFVAGLHAFDFLKYVPGDANILHWFNVAPAALCLGSLPFVWRLLGPGQALYVLVAMAVPLSAGLESLGRYLSVLFPVYVVLAYYCRSADWQRLIIVTFALFQAFLAILYTGWYRVI